VRDVFPRYDERNRDPRQRWLGRLLRRIVPRHTFEPLRFELHAARVRLRAGKEIARWRDARGLLVNLGCGPHGKPGWVNVDLFAAPGVDCVYDCRKSLPFADGAARGIFCEHFLEHVDYTEEVPYFLAECHRVLEPGGTVRIVVPDFESYARAYASGDWTGLEDLRALGEGREDPFVRGRYTTRMELLNVVFRQGFEHKYAYDFETLRVLLETFGFARIERTEFGLSLLPELALDQPARRSESLYVDAVK
jgi:predicted SAM-dependent methyltransferase